MVFLLGAVYITSTYLSSFVSAKESTSGQLVNGVVMKGAFVNMKQNVTGTPAAPPNYIENSIKMISRAGLNHIRFVFYWEAYERDPEAFMNEIQSVARAADKYGVKIIYDNHQWHTSSWFEERGTGFPWSLFEDNSKYSRGGGGNTVDKSAKIFWNDWWKKAVKDKQGKDGWKLMAEFLKKIVLTVDNHSSTLGYEILSEPHVHNQGQWSKIGKFNSFITKELRNITSKTIVYSMNVPIDLNSKIKISAKNLAKMAPSNKDNVVFKISVYGDPDKHGYQKKRFGLFLRTSHLAGVPLYVGEWNNVVRTKQGGITKLNPHLSELTKTDAKQILKALKRADVWGTAFWRWDYQHIDTASFNLVSDKNGKLVPTRYLGILKGAVEKIYGFPETTNPSIGARSSSNQDHNDSKPQVTNTNNPEDYENLGDLVHDIRIHVVDTEDISLKNFQDSGAYQGTDQQTQDCIDLAAKIGNKLGDQEIVRCYEDANYFKNKISNRNKNNSADNPSN